MHAGRKSRAEACGGVGTTGDLLGVVYVAPIKLHGLGDRLASCRQAGYTPCQISPLLTTDHAGYHAGYRQSSTAGTVSYIVLERL